MNRSVSLAISLMWIILSSVFQSVGGVKLSLLRPRYKLEHQKRLKHKHTLDGRKLNDDQDWRALSIKFDLSLIKNPTHPISTFITKTILPDVAEFFKALLSVKGKRSLPTFSILNCLQENEIPVIYKNSEVTTDLLLFVKIQEFQENFLAYATNCLLSADNYQPLVGLIMVNSNYIPLTYSAIEPLKKAIIHEIFHVLAFDRYLYKRYPSFQATDFIVNEINSQMNTNSSLKPDSFSKNSLQLSSKIIQEAGTRHFGCKDFYGLIMENEGGNASEQSHLDQTYFGNELMTAELSGNGVLSIFTLALLASTKWYNVNMGLEEIYEWGKGAGCDFLFSPGSKLPEFCQNEVRSCSRQRFKRTKCQVSKFSNNFGIAWSSDLDSCSNNFNFQFLYPYEQNGPHSRCLDIEVSGQKMGGCYKTDCSNYNSLTVIIEQKKFICNAKGQKITYNNLVVVCPDRSEVCVSNCPNDCSGNGICLANNTCQCFHFFSDKDCSKKRACNSDEAAICDKIAPVPAVNSVEASTSTDYSKILKNVGKVLDPNESTSSFNLEKILTKNNFDFQVAKTNSKEIAIPINGSSNKSNELTSVIDTAQATQKTQTLANQKVSNPVKGLFIISYQSFLHIFLIWFILIK